IRIQEQGLRDYCPYGQSLSFNEAILRMLAARSFVTRTHHHSRPIAANVNKRGGSSSDIRAEPPLTVFQGCFVGSVESMFAGFVGAPRCWITGSVAGFTNVIRNIAPGPTRTSPPLVSNSPPSSPPPIAAPAAAPPPPRSTVARPPAPPIVAPRSTFFAVLSPLRLPLTLPSSSAFIFSS